MLHFLLDLEEGGADDPQALSYADLDDEEINGVSE